MKHGFLLWNSFLSSWLNKRVPVSRQHLGCGPFEPPPESGHALCFPSLSVAIQQFRMPGLVHFWRFLEAIIKEACAPLQLVLCCSSARAHEHAFGTTNSCEANLEPLPCVPGKSLVNTFGLRYWKAPSFHLILVADAESLSVVGRQSVCQDPCWLWAGAVLVPCAPCSANPLSPVFSLGTECLGHKMSVCSL